MFRTITTALWVLFLATGLTTTASAGDWQGKEVTKEGSRFVLNPAKSMESAKSVELEELWRLGGDTDDEDEFFGVISSIMTDPDGNVYILDTQLSQVKVFTKDGEFAREIGREGEGPGEFRFPTGMFFTPEGHIAVVQVQPGRIVLLSKTGEPMGEHPIPKKEGGSFIVLTGGQSQGGNTVLQFGENAFDQEANTFEQTRFIASVTSDGKEGARYCSDSRKMNLGNAVMDDKQWDTFDRRWSVGPDGRVYAALDFDDYRIHVWNQDGSVDRIIEREYAHVKRTDEEKQVLNDMMELFAQRIPNGATIKINDYNKDVESFYVREDGSMWVLSSKGSRNLDGALGVFDVYDPKGRFVRHVTLNGEGDPLVDGYYFVKDRLYVVTDLLQAAISLNAGGGSFQVGEEEPEPMSVICYELSGNFLTSMR